MSASSVLAIVPARGGSKGLPGKNIRPLVGLPLLVHSLRCAAMSPEIGRCVVSTDSEEIADVARAHGGDVPFLRPAELGRDDTPTMPVLRHALAAVEAAEGRTYDYVLLLEPTSPARLPGDITAAVAMLDADPHADGVVACSKPHFNPFYVGVVDRGGYLHPAFEASAGHTRRQDVPEFFRITGALYLWRRAFVLTDDWPRGKHLRLTIPELRAISIDDADEFALAELIIGSGLQSLPWLASASPASATET